MTEGSAPHIADDFLQTLRQRAAARPRTLVFPEGDEPRVQDAVVECLRDGLANVVVIARSPDAGDAILARAADRPEPSPLQLLQADDRHLVERTEVHLRDVRRDKGDSQEAIESMARDPLFQAGMLVTGREAHGAVAGAVRTTADVVRAALVSIGTADRIRTLSSAFYMVFEGSHTAGPAVLTFTDAGVVPQPTSEQLAEIALSASHARARIVGDEPRVGFLSYSTKGSAEGPAVERVREAFLAFREIAPDVSADGELQGDAALSPAIAERKAPGSEVAGRTNVLVFPDLGAANLAYKLVQHLGGAVALGPVLQGLALPYNDLSRGATTSDIVSVACITSLMAE